MRHSCCRVLGNTLNPHSRNKRRRIGQGDFGRSRPTFHQVRARLPPSRRPKSGLGGSLALPLWEQTRVTPRSDLEESAIGGGTSPAIEARAARDGAGDPLVANEPARWPTRTATGLRPRGASEDRVPDPHACRSTIETALHLITDKGRRALFDSRAWNMFERRDRVGERAHEAKKQWRLAEYRDRIEFLASTAPPTVRNVNNHSIILIKSAIRAHASVEQGSHPKPVAVGRRWTSSTLRYEVNSEILPYYNSICDRRRGVHGGASRSVGDRPEGSSAQ